MATNERQLSFSVKGEFITEAARDQFYSSNKLRYALDLLTSCLQTDQLTDDQRIMLAIRILNGDMEIVGTYPGPDYQVIDVPKDKKNPRFDILAHLEKQTKQVETLKEQNRKLCDRFSFLAENLPIHTVDKLNRQWYDETDESEPLIYEPSEASLSALRNNRNLDMSPELKDYMEQSRIERDMPDEDHYGWLEPDGTFHPVPWGEHQTWAYTYVKEHFPEEAPQFNDGCCGDILLKHNWILLHSTSMGLARPQWNSERRVTKRQREFLYDYYTERGCHDEAQKWLDA